MPEIFPGLTFVSLCRRRIFAMCYLWKCWYRVYWNLSYPLSFLKVIFLKSNPFWFKEIVILVNNKQKWRHRKGYAIKHYATRNVDHRSHF
jgi:hypothetical protein